MGSAFHLGLVVTALGFGFRHGIDWDHIAALTDLTSTQQHPRRSMFFATLYALGHAVVVFGLGLAAIVFAARLPSGVDAVMERFVGVTLVVLGVYVLIALARRRDGFRMRSRFMLLHAGFRNARNWLRRSRLVPAPAHAHAHTHGPVLATSDEPYAPRTAFGIGMVHGIGAETPTQVLIFLTAAGAGGKPLGVFILVCFLAGLIASNTLVAVAGTLGFLSAERNTTVYVAVSAVTALFSLVIGSILLFGSATMLPSLLGG
jgi:hypothetical protein